MAAIAYVLISACVDEVRRFTNSHSDKSMVAMHGAGRQFCSTTGASELPKLRRSQSLSLQSL